MFGLVDTYFAAAGEGQGGECSPALFVRVRDGHLFLFEMLQGCGDVIAQEEQLVPFVLLGHEHFRAGCRAVHVADQTLFQSVARGLELLPQVFPLLIVER